MPDSFLTREQLLQKLQALAKSPPPENLSLGAMCYAIAPGPEEADYICPDCGTRTHYSIRCRSTQAAKEVARDAVSKLRRQFLRLLRLNWQEKRVIEPVDEDSTDADPSSEDGVRRSRRSIVDNVRFLHGTQARLNDIVGLDVRLDAREYCERCCPGILAPRLFLVVHHSDGSQHRIACKDQDLILLVEFTSGKLTHDRGAAGEEPLKKHVARLEKLLGIKIGHQS